MPTDGQRPERIFSEGVELPDGRKVRVLGYDDRSVRFRIDGTPYAMVEAFLQGGSGDHAIIKLIPVSQWQGEAAEIPNFPCPHDGCDTVAKSIPGLRKHVKRFHSLEAHARMLGVSLDEDDEQQAS